MKDGAKYLTECGLRPSMQRLAIYKYMATHPTHPTADEIFEALREVIPTLSKTTVYNTLKLFVEHGVVDEVFIDRMCEGIFIGLMSEINGEPVPTPTPAPIVPEEGTTGQ